MRGDSFGGWRHRGRGNVGAFTLIHLRPVPDSVLWAERRRQTVTLRAIEICVTNEFKLTFEQMRKKSNSKHHGLPRMLFYYLAREWTGQSYPTIAKYFGGRDHTTILSGCRNMAYLIENDEDWQLRATAVVKELQARGYNVGWT